MPLYLCDMLYYVIWLLALYLKYSGKFLFSIECCENPKRLCPLSTQRHFVAISKWLLRKVSTNIYERKKNLNGNLSSFFHMTWQCHGKFGSVCLQAIYTILIWKQWSVKRIYCVSLFIKSVSANSYAWICFKMSYYPFWTCLWFWL